MAVPSNPASKTSSVKEEIHPPQVDGFKIKGSLKGDLKSIATTLRAISFLEVAPEKNLVNVVYVESRDINKNPYLFSILKIKDDEIEMLYSIPSEISPRKRRIDVIMYLLNLLSLIESNYLVDNKVIYQLLDSAIKDLMGSVSMDYSKLYTSYDSLKKEVDDYRKKVEWLNSQTQALNTKNFELKSQNDELRLRLESLENISEQVLKSKLQEWILEHNGSISISDFSKVHKVAESRVEEVLNRLVSEGYLEVVQ
jgi:regulator of replication initiation timing